MWIGLLQLSRNAGAGITVGELLPLRALLNGGVSQKGAQLTAAAPGNAHVLHERGDLNVSGSEIIGLMLSVGLLVYLTIALLKPEWFA